MSILDRTLLVCPTLNPGDSFVEWIGAYENQKIKPGAVLIVDSASDDDVVINAKKHDFLVNIIDRKTFNHGGTRQKAIEENVEFDYIIFLTQDAFLQNDLALAKLLSAFDDPDVAAAYGRQLPRKNASVIERHARLYSYPAIPSMRMMSDAKTLGVKTAFLSNSFAAYRRNALVQVSGFPDNVIFGEDMFVAAKLLKAGYKIAYVADACVYHSHGYSLAQEMRRYFDMGVFHAREPWLRDEFGGAEKEGMKFVLSEFRYLLRHAFWKIPEGLLRTVLRYLGFRLGLAEKYIPLVLKKRLCMNKGYFKHA